MTVRADSLQDLLRALESRLESLGDRRSLEILDQVIREIPQVSIDQRNDFKTLRELPMRFFLETTRLPEVTIKHRNMTYKMESPIVVSCEMEAL